MGWGLKRDMGGEGLRRGCPYPGRFTEVKPVATTARENIFSERTGRKRHTSQPFTPGGAILSEPTLALACALIREEVITDLGRQAGTFSPRLTPQASLLRLWVGGAPKNAGARPGAPNTRVTPR